MAIIRENPSVRRLHVRARWLPALSSNQGPGIRSPSYLHRRSKSRCGPAPSVDMSSSAFRRFCRTHKICETMAEPMSAPSKIAVPARIPTPPVVAKFDTGTATAVAICMHEAANTPLPRACILFAIERRKKAREAARNGPALPTAATVGQPRKAGRPHRRYARQMSGCLYYQLITSFAESAALTCPDRMEMGPEIAQLE